MGCTASRLPAVEDLVPQKHPAKQLLDSSVVTTGGTVVLTTSFFNKSYKENATQTMLDVMNDGRVFAQFGSRTFDGNDQRGAMQHLIPICDASRNLVAAVMPNISTKSGALEQVIATTSPRCRCFIPLSMQLDGKAFYPWAKCDAAGKIYPVQPDGSFGRMTMRVTNIGLTTDYKFVNSDGEPVAIAVARLGFGDCKYTCAAGVDPGLILAAHIAYLKRMDANE